MPQAPSVQVAAPWAGVGQAMPHAPQLAASASVFTHLPSQAIVSPGHVVPHMPCVHTSFSAQGESQPPQCAALTFVSMQDEPHFAKPSRQLKVQSPSEQEAIPLVGASQALPQAPQFITSASVSRQVVPLQGVKPSSHSVAHVPPTHMLRPLAGVGQALPHSPQWRAEALTSTQEPPQFSSPPEQASLQDP
jgi:hypothetical protein